MSKDTDIWMPIVIGDYLKDTQHLDAERSGCYLHWLMHYWLKGPLPNSIQELILIGKLRGADAPSIAQALLAEFFKLSSDGLYHQKRADSEKATWKGKRQKARDKACKAAQTRWRKDAPSIAQAYAQAVPEDMHTECPSPSPISTPKASEAVLASEAKFNSVVEPTFPATQNPSREDAEPELVLTSEPIVIPPAPKARKRAPEKPKKIPPIDRHMEFRRDFEKYFRHKNNCEAPWDAQQATHLAKWLKANPDIDDEQWRTILTNRARSPGVSQTRPLSQWIANAKAWLHGRADDFGRAIDTGGTNGRSNSRAKEERTIEALNQVLAGIPEVDRTKTG